MEYNPIQHSCLLAREVTIQSYSVFLNQVWIFLSSLKMNTHNFHQNDYERNEKSMGSTYGVWLIKRNSITLISYLKISLQINQWWIQNKSEQCGVIKFACCEHMKERVCVNTRVHMYLGSARVINILIIIMLNRPLVNDDTRPIPYGIIN